jgi:3alpha(or 20beta)-hydroxysteroid dehydrogenase
VIGVGSRSERLNGKLAIVTGGARGQGEEMCRAFAAEGARVLVCDILDAQGKAVALSIGEAATYRHLDVTSEAGWHEVVDCCTATLGLPTILVNNAGIIRTGWSPVSCIDWTMWAATSTCTGRGREST